VRRGGNRVRITAQLIDAETSNHLWAERYDRDPSDIFAVQDEITEAVSIAIEPTVVATERRRAVQKPPEDLSAWEAYQRGRWHGGHISAEENDKAKSCFRQAIERDPNFAPAHAGLAFAILQSAYVFQKATLAEAADEALAHARKAIALNPLDAVPHACLGHVLVIRGDLEGALTQLRKALSISPNFAGAYHLLGFALIYSGEPRQGIEAIRNAMRLDPHDPSPMRSFQIAHGHYFLREYDAGADAAKQAIRAHPDHALAYRWLAAALGQAGRPDEARQALDKAMSLAPKSFDMFVRQRAPWMRAEQHEHMLDGLRKAGWEG
jgi:adenylate cyclase